jgi:tRNA pseudouridine55 synthase
VVVDKPSGLTSHDVVARLRRIFGTKRVGHTGTLDPLATGVLVICLGHATRAAEYLAATRKEYVAEAVFGLSTDSQDVTGATIAEASAGHLTREDVEAALPAFRGAIQQVPPMVSAVHHQGQRLYELARKGITVERAARPVEIHALDLLDFTPGERPRASLRVECSTGTYVRTLCADIGEALGVGGTMAALRRTRSGAMSLDAAYTLETLEDHKAAGTLPEAIRPLREALAEWPQVELTPDGVRDVAHGRAVHADTALPEGALVLLVAPDRSEVAIAGVRAGLLQPSKVFLTEPPR